ncbi:MAG: hypothetical protein SFU27_04085 [Thermonemataceae bacterium]|nr:hypothetical protein [Thermonemataceae bacterium]
MNKIWINKEKGEDKIIAIDSDKLFKINPETEKIFQYVSDIENNIISKDVLSIPFSYIKTIQYQEGKNYIQVFFGQESEEHLRVNDVLKLRAIFQYFKENIPKIEYRFEKYSAIKSARKPLRAVIVTSLLFIWTLYYAMQIGYKYELIGSGKSITGIVFALAHLGIVNVSLIFCTLIGVGLFSMIKKMRNRPLVHKLYILRNQ